MNDDRKLNIVDESGMIIGEDTRENIHRLGLLHREIHVWFYTPRDEIVFQHRAKDKDTYPDLLDATVGGHVEIGSDFTTTALTEMEEETGLRTAKENIKLIKTVRVKSFDNATKKINNVIRAVYAYLFEGRLDDLQVEKGKAIGFESWSLEKIFDISEDEKKLFVGTILQAENLNIFKDIRKLYENIRTGQY